jgi:hypothetical protein
VLPGSVRCGTSSEYIREGQQGVELAAAIDKRNPARAADCNAADSGPSTVLSTRRSQSSLAQSCRSPTGKRRHSLTHSLVIYCTRLTPARVPYLAARRASSPSSLPPLACATSSPDSARPSLPGECQRGLCSAGLVDRLGRVVEEGRHDRGRARGLAEDRVTREGE